MTLQHINNILDQMRQVAQSDPESFNSLQKQLYKDLLIYFCNNLLGPHHVSELAEAVLRSEEIETKW